MSDQKASPTNAEILVKAALQGLSVGFERAVKDGLRVDAIRYAGVILAPVAASLRATGTIQGGLIGLALGRLASQFTSSWLTMMRASVDAELAASDGETPEPALDAGYDPDSDSDPAD